MARATTAAALVCLLGALTAASGADALPAGQVRLAKAAGSEMDRWMVGAPPARRAWFRRRHERMRGYPPWFDRRLSWYPNAWAYMDLVLVR